MRTGYDLSARLRAFGVEFRDIRPLAGDVSGRLYSRVTTRDGSTLIAVLYPPDMLDACVRFRAAADLLTSAGVRVPDVLEADCTAGVMLVEDAGDRSMYDFDGSSWGTLRPLYRQALGQIRRIQEIPLAAVEALNPPLDGAALRLETDLCWEQFLDRPAISGSAELRRRLRRALDALCGELDRAPLVACHRDFMPRNLQVTGAQREIVVIDHQDLRPGPPVYDLASLLNDSLFPPPVEERALRAEAIRGEKDLLLYRRCVVQRALKASHTFVRFARLGDPRHVRLVRPTLARAAYQLARLPEGRGVGDSLADRWGALEPTSLIEESGR